MRMYKKVWKGNELLCRDYVQRIYMLTQQKTGIGILRQIGVRSAAIDIE